MENQKQKRVTTPEDQNLKTTEQNFIFDIFQQLSLCFESGKKPPVQQQKLQLFN